MKTHKGKEVPQEDLTIARIVVAEEFRQNPAVFIIA